MNKYGERRCNMRDEFHPDRSVEKMAAWLDGNLSLEDMTQMTARIQNDPMLKEIVAMSDEIDSDMEAFVDSGEPLPKELQNDDFDLPKATPWLDRQVGNMYDEICCNIHARYPEYDCCDAAPASAEREDSDEETGILDKLKGLFSKEKEE